MSDDTELSQRDRPPEKKTPLPAGQVYIGMSNTRGVIMQIHAQRFQQALTLNLVGLVGFVAWLASNQHDEAILVIAGIGCVIFMLLDALWIALLRATEQALIRWTAQIDTLVDILGIEGILQSGEGKPLPKPPVPGWTLYLTLYGCIVAWGVILALIYNALR